MVPVMCGVWEVRARIQSPAPRGVSCGTGHGPVFLLPLYGPAGRERTTIHETACDTARSVHCDIDALREE